MTMIDTTDRDEAEEALSRTFPGIELARDAAGREFRLQHSRAEHGMLTTTRLRVRGEAVMSGLYPEHHLAVGRRHHGRVDIRYGQSRLDTTRPYLRPPGDFEGVYTNADVELLIVDRSSFTSLASRHLEGTGRRLLPPDPRISATEVDDGDRLWDAAADIVAATLARSPSELDLRLLEDLVVSTVLLAFPLTAEASTPTGTGVLPRALRRATDYIAEHLAEPISTVMIADAARISLRTLQLGFRRHLGTTPTEYLRQARLAAAHADLLRGDPSETSVGLIARRWGFTHLARFSASYRQEYGRYPRETLRL